tara:strand:- start:381 stop:569 length:189 start_codon:yes stop_codon:yes gene_type:complete
VIAKELSWRRIHSGFSTYGAGERYRIEGELSFRIRGFVFLEAGFLPKIRTGTKQIKGEEACL